MNWPRELTWWVSPEGHGMSFSLKARRFEN
jgi:hypothetical protein